MQADEYLGLAENAANFLAKLVRADGSFIYRYDVARGCERKGYNVLRHAGCVWALNQAASILPVTAEYRAASARALGWLLGRKVMRNEQDKLCVVENGQIKLGGTALAILAAISAPSLDGRGKWSDHPINAAALAKFCNYILDQITKNSDFVHKRDAATGAIDPFRSNYYTGQALFALLSALSLYPDPDRLDLVYTIMKDLMARDYGVDQQSHWMMYAAESAYALVADDLILRYSAGVIQNILDVPLYRESQRCTPIACRTEAMLCYLRLLRRAGEPEGRLSARVLDEIAINLSLQKRNALPGGAFCRGGGSWLVQIDYIQHNLAAFLGYVTYYHKAPTTIERH